jgi:ADP-ribosylglycohydrolase
VPLTLALFLLADGEVERCVTYGANLGRDADTIASMAGAMAGALRGAENPSRGARRSVAGRRSARISLRAG